MCQYGLYELLCMVAHRYIYILMCLLAAEPLSTPGFHSTLCISVERSCSPLFDTVGLRGFKNTANAFWYWLPTWWVHAHVVWGYLSATNCISLTPLAGICPFYVWKESILCLEDKNRQWRHIHVVIAKFLLALYRTHNNKLPWFLYFSISVLQVSGVLHSWDWC